MIIDSEEPNGHEPELPGWFVNQGDQVEDDQDDGLSSRQRIVIAAAALVILVLLLIPVLQAVVLERNRQNLPDEQFQRAALQFTSAVYFTRSMGQAMLFADRDARDDVEAVVEYFRDQPPNSARARVQVSVTPCPREWNAASICFRGRLYDPSASLVPPIAFGLAERGDRPLVIFVQLDLASA